MRQKLLNNLRKPARNPTVQAAALIALSVMIFLGTPLQQISDHTFSAVDIGQFFPLTYVSSPPDYHPSNVVLGDVWNQFDPWLLFNRDSLRSGNIPLWNPYNANGVPHLANYQSAVLSVYSLPIYLLPFKYGILLSAFLKLFIIGLFTFLFLKQLGLGQIPALVGGIAFTFCGYNIVWLDMQNTSTVTMLPCALYFAERCFKIFQRRNSAPLTPFPTIVSLIGLSLSLVIGLLAGQPETFYFCALLLGGYILFRLIMLWWSAADRQAILPSLARLTLALAATALFALGISAVQLLPFAEYLANSSAAGTAHSNLGAAASAIEGWPLAFYPNLLGYPSDRYTFDLLQGSPLFFNYNETNDAYLGSAVLFAATLGGLSIAAIKDGRRRALLGFFALAAILWLIYLYNVFGLKPLFNLLPGAAYTGARRSMPIGLFAISACAAMGLDWLLTAHASAAARLRQALAILGVGLGLLAISLYGAAHLLGTIGASLFMSLAQVNGGVKNPVLVMGHADVVIGHLTAIALGLTITVGAAALIRLNRNQPRTRRLKEGLALVIGGIVFLQSGYLLRNYDLTIDDRYFYPATPDIQQLQQSAAGKLLLVAPTYSVLLPDMNLVYGFSITDSYDTLGIRFYDDLHNTLFSAMNAPAPAQRAISELGLKLFGINAVLTPNLAAYPALSQSTISTAYRLIDQTNAYALFAYIPALPRYHVVSEALAASTDSQAMSLLTQPGFDPARTVILDSPDAPPLQPPNASDATTPVSQVLRDDSTRVQIKVSALKQGGYLVLDRAYYPGWKAMVNGTPQQVYRANYAFSAVLLPPGDNLIDFYYDPDSFKFGAIISLSSVGLGLLSILFVIRIATRAVRL